MTSEMLWYLSPSGSLLPVSWAQLLVSWWPSSVMWGMRMKLLPCLRRSKPSSGEWMSASIMLDCPMKHRCYLELPVTGGTWWRCVQSSRSPFHVALLEWAWVKLEPTSIQVSNLVDVVIVSNLEAAVLFFSNKLYFIMLLTFMLSTSLLLLITYVLCFPLDA